MGEGGHLFNRKYRIDGILICQNTLVLLIFSLKQYPDDIQRSGKPEILRPLYLYAFAKAFKTYLKLHVLIIHKIYL